MSHIKTIIYEPSWDCGCRQWTYNQIDADMGVYKARCQDCGRMLDEERAQKAIEISETLTEIADYLKKNGGKWDFTDDSGFPMIHCHVDDTLYIGDIVLSPDNTPCAIIPLGHLPDEIIKQILSHM